MDQRTDSAHLNPNYGICTNNLSTTQTRIVNVTKITKTFDVDVSFGFRSIIFPSSQCYNATSAGYLAEIMPAFVIRLIPRLPSRFDISMVCGLSNCLLRVKVKLEVKK